VSTFYGLLSLQNGEVLWTHYTFSFLTATRTMSVPLGCSTSVIPKNYIKHTVDTMSKDLSYILTLYFVCNGDWVDKHRV